MSITVPNKALVVVADGRKAVLFRNEISKGEVSLHDARPITPQNLEDEGPSGSRPEEQSARQTDEATFAKQLAEALYLMKHRGEYENLVLVADPQTLGQIRECLHKTVEASISLSLAKDLTKHSVEQINSVLNAY